MIFEIQKYQYLLIDEQYKLMLYCNEYNSDINEMEQNINEYPVLIQNKLKSIPKE